MKTEKTNKPRWK